MKRLEGEDEGLELYLILHPNEKKKFRKLKKQKTNGYPKGTDIFGKKHT